MKNISVAKVIYAPLFLTSSFLTSSKVLYFSCSVPFCNLIFVHPQITQIKNGDSPSNKKIAGLGPKAKTSPNVCLKSNSPTLAVRKDLKAKSPKLVVRKDLLKANPSPLASKRAAPPASSPIPCKTTYVTQSDIPAGLGNPPDKHLNFRRSSPRKSVAGPNIDCITIDDSN